MKWPTLNEVVLVPATIWGVITLWRKDRRDRKRDKAARERSKARVIQFTSKDTPPEPES